MPNFGTGNVSEMYTWAHIEPSCSILAACFPTYGPLFIGDRFTWPLLKSMRSWFSISSFRSTRQPISDDSSDTYLAGSKSEASKGDMELSYINHPASFRPPEGHKSHSQVYAASEHQRVMNQPGHVAGNGGINVTTEFHARGHRI